MANTVDDIANTAPDLDEDAAYLSDCSELQSINLEEYEL